MRLKSLQKPAASGQLEVLRQYPRLLPVLLIWGLEVQDAVAVAYNVALLHRAAVFDPPVASPRALLDCLSLGEIAELCEQLQGGGEDCGFNVQYEEGIV